MNWASDQVILMCNSCGRRWAMVCCEASDSAGRGRRYDFFIGLSMESLLSPLLKVNIPEVEIFSWVPKIEASSGQICLGESTSQSGCS